MKDSEIREVVYRLLHRIAPEADIQECDGEVNFRQAFDIDSYDFLRFIIAINEELKVEIPEGEYSRVSTLNGLIGHLSARIH